MDDGMNYESEASKAVREAEKQIKKEEKQKKKEKRKGTWAIIFVVLLFGGMGIFLLFTGVRDLFFAESLDINEVAEGISKNAVYEGDVYYTTACYCEMSHSINGLIPTGKEYYYLVFLEDGRTAISVRGDKHWADELLTQEHFPIMGIAKELDYKIRNNLQELINGNRDVLLGTKVTTMYYIDLIYVQIAIYKLIVGVIFAGGILFYLLMFLTKKQLPALPPVLGKVLLIAMIPALWFLLHMFTMAF